MESGDLSVVSYIFDQDPTSESCTKNYCIWHKEWHHGLYACHHYTLREQLELETELMGWNRVSRVFGEYIEKMTKEA